MLVNRRVLFTGKRRGWVSTSAFDIAAR
jgi:hypothetical protein